GDCVMTPPNTDGCETALDTILNCAGCGQKCDISNASMGSCDGMRCNYVCQPLFADCDQAGADLNGCETSLTDPTNCGGCGKMCDGLHSTGAMCNGTTCSHAGCQAGYADCTMNAPDADGCETNLNAGVNCGGCGKICDTLHSNGAMCVNGACTYSSCKAG